LALEAARFQMSRKEDSWLKFLELNGQSHQELALDGVSLKKGFMAGFVRGQLTDSRSDAYQKGDGSLKSRKEDSWLKWLELNGQSHRPEGCG